MFIHAVGPQQLWAKYSICRDAAHLNANVQSGDALTEGYRLQRPSLTLSSPSGMMLADAGKQ